MPDNPHSEPNAEEERSATPHRRRTRYKGKHPRRFEEKYKELDPSRHAETVAKVLASGKTVAGTHRPIMVDEILAALDPRPGDVAIDGTLGYGGHSEAILRRIQPGGHLIGMDRDPIELPKTEARLRALGFGPDTFTSHSGNFAGMPKALATAGFEGADLVLADLGLSSMQIDDPARGFSVKFDGPLDMRMNPRHGQPASALIARLSVEELEHLLALNADEPQAVLLSEHLAGQCFGTTIELAQAVRSILSELDPAEAELSVRRVFQALRIAVNDEFGSLDTLLRVLPYCLRSGGRVAILTFHSGEDRRVKKAFASGLHDGLFAEVSDGVIRASAEERHANPRSTSAKLRWARRA